MSYNDALEELNRLEPSVRLRDPETAREEVQKIVADEIQRAGLRPAERTVSLREKILEAGRKFMARHAHDYLPTPQNEAKMFSFLEENGLPYTLQSFEQAFTELRDELEKPSPNRAVPRTAPRTVNGIRITHEFLDTLSAADMERLSASPQFVEAVNALPPRGRT